MPLITLDQILSPLRLDPNDPLRLLMSGSFSVTGSINTRQTNANIPALIVSGSQNTVNASGSLTGSINIFNTVVADSNGIDGNVVYSGSFGYDF
jgi:hypothetical protein